MTSVGIEVVDAAMDIEKLEAWLRKLLSTRGEDIFRSKGILNVSGTDERYVFQGVHMMMEMSSSAEGEFEGWVKDAKRVVVPEVNFTGQLARLIKAETGIELESVAKCDGLPFTAEAIMDLVTQEVAA